MNLLPMRQTEYRPAERMPSIVLGVTSLSIGLGALILLSSYLMDRPIASSEFYAVELVKVVDQDASGKPIVMNPVKRIVPSMTMIWALFFGACNGGLGIHLSLTESNDRKATTSAAGLLACSLAFALVLVLVGLAAS